MFQLGVVDHVRLNSGRAIQNYTVHARAAERLAGLTSKVRIGVLILAAITATAAILAVLRGTPAYHVSAAVAAGLTFLTFAVYLASDLESRVHAHRACAHRLWILCERHRILLAEMNDGLLDRTTLLHRSDELAMQMHTAYEQTFAAGQRAFEVARQVDASDEEGGKENGAMRSAMEQPSERAPSPVQH
jgi:conflict system pore-forming effector with SLATT domain